MTKNVVGKSERKRSLERCRGRWDNNIKMYVKGIRCDDVDRFCLAQDSHQWLVLVKTVMNLPVT